MDVKKQEEMISELYRKFLPQPKVEGVAEVVKIEKVKDAPKEDKKPKTKKTKTK